MYQITCSINYAIQPSLFKLWSSLMPMSHPRRTLQQWQTQNSLFWLVYKREIIESIADTHSAVNRVAYLIAAENYYMVFIEGVLLQGHSAIGIKKHDVPGRCWYVMGKFYIRSCWLLAITSQPWSKRPSKLHLNMPILKVGKEGAQGIWVLVAKASKRVMVMNSWLEASKGTMVTSSWQKPIMGATLNQTHKGVMIASLWKESIENI